MNDRRQERPVHILLVEDNEADARFFQEMLKSVSIPTVVHTVDDGRPALAFLHKLQEYAQAPTPEIIFLDVLLPVLSGPEVFVAMKTDAALAQIPVCLLVLDGNDLSLEQIESQGFQVERWLPKPVQAAQLTAILRTVRRPTVCASLLQERRGKAQAVRGTLSDML